MHHFIPWYLGSPLYNSPKQPHGWHVAKTAPKASCKPRARSAVPAPCKPRAGTVQAPCKPVQAPSFSVQALLEQVFLFGNYHMEACRLSDQLAYYNIKGKYGRAGPGSLHGLRALLELYEVSSPSSRILWSEVLEFYGVAF